MKKSPINPLPARVFTPGTPSFPKPVLLTGFILALLLLSLALPTDLLAYSGDSGTESNPYEIFTVAVPADLNMLTNTPDAGNPHFIQTADIALIPVTSSIIHRDKVPYI